MKRTRLKRNTPFRAKDPEKIKRQLHDWKARSKRLSHVSKVRRNQNAAYLDGRDDFLRCHTVCPVTGEPTTQIHHSAKREREWLNLQRYWIAVSAQGHAWIEDNKAEAEKFGLMVRIRETYAAHLIICFEENYSLTRPVFYDHWDGVPLFQKG